MLIVNKILLKETRLKSCDTANAISFHPFLREILAVGHPGSVGQMKGRYPLRGDEKRERDRVRFTTRLLCSFFGPFGVNGHLSESDVSSLTEDGKEHLLAAKMVVYRTEKWGEEAARRRERGIKGGRLK